MRSVVTVLVIVALLAIWLITRYSDDTGPNEALTGGGVTPVTISTEPDLPLADRQEFQATNPDAVISDTEAITHAIESNTFSGSAVRTSVIEFDPEQRTRIVDYLSESGLAVVDSERIADSALDGVRECVEQAFGNSNGANSYLIETCMFNVFATYGLTRLQ